jgi:ADP-heptose:LPS heptosyltransferase
LGDFLTGVPAYRAIGRAFPEHRVVLAAPRELEPLVELVGAFAALHPTLPLAPLDAALQRADVAIDLHGRGPASHRILLAARPRRLIGFRNAEIPASADGAEWRADEHEVARWCRLLTHAGIAADPRELDLRLPAAELWPDLGDATLLHPGAASEARRWPADRWAAVARLEAAVGRRVILTGSASERPRALQIAQAAGLDRRDVVAGRTGLRELAGLVASVGRVVSGDTGLAHLATALRTPSVVLFGPISPAHWGPPADRLIHHALWLGRTGDPHGARIDPGLLDISVEMVCGAVRTLPDRFVATGS